MTFLETQGFKYFKNFVIGVGAALVMLGALGKINSFEWGGLAITEGLVTEAIIFLFLGILPPQKDYYWDILYLGLAKVNADIALFTPAGVAVLQGGIETSSALYTDFLVTRLVGI